MATTAEVAPVTEPVASLTTEANVETKPEEKPEKAVKEKKPKVPKEKKPKVAKPVAAHPPYVEMIREAIATLKERTGSSHYAIAKHLEDKYKTGLPPNFKKTLSVQLRNLSAQGKLTKIKNSFKLSDELKKEPKASKAGKTVKAPKAGAEPVVKRSAGRPKGSTKAKAANGAASPKVTKVKAPKATKVKAVKAPKTEAKTVKVAKASKSPTKEKVGIPAVEKPAKRKAPSQRKAPIPKAATPRKTAVAKKVTMPKKTPKSIKSPKSPKAAKSPKAKVAATGTTRRSASSPAAKKQKK